MDAMLCELSSFTYRFSTLSCDTVTVLLVFQVTFVFCGCCDMLSESSNGQPAEFSGVDGSGVSTRGVSTKSTSHSAAVNV